MNMSLLSPHLMNGVLGCQMWLMSALLHSASALSGGDSFAPNCVHLVVGCVSALLFVGSVLFGVCWCKQKGKIDELKRKNEDWDHMTRVETTLQEHKRRLEEIRDQLNEQLKKLQTEKEENKKKLQSVEEEITEREKRFDKPEKLIQQKESLLKAQWKLDETKKNDEKLQMKIENLLESLEKLRKRREAETWSD